LSGLPADYDLKLYNSSGTLLNTSQNVGTTTETIKYNTTSVGTYYAYVYGYGGVFNASACYSLNASISGTAFKLGEDLTNDSDKPTALVLPNLFPNPSSGNVRLEVNFIEPSERVSVFVFDMLGKLVISYDYQNVEGLLSTNLNLSDATNGIYTVAIKSDFGQETRKLIIAK
jgi:hypothetical protein